MLSFSTLGRSTGKLWPAAFAIAAIALFALPAAASARGTATVSGSTVNFTTGASDTNNVTLGFDGAKFVISDSGATIQAGAGCTQNGSNAVKCGTSTTTRLAASLGAGNDQLVVSSLGIPAGKSIVIDAGSGDDAVLTDLSSATATLTGGDGADHLLGGNGNDGVSGGPGNDIVRGGPGNDVVHGDDGDDQVQPNGGADLAYGDAGSDSILIYETTADGADLLDGGDGSDTVEYRSGFNPLSVSLDGVANDGPLGDADNVLVENVGSGLGSSSTAFRDNDTVTGSAGANFLNAGRGNDTLSGLAGDDTVLGAEGADVVDGGEGNDTLFGDFATYSTSGNGNDTITGGAGRDTISAGAGDDTVFANDGEADSIACGLGSDVVHADALDTVSSDCEVVTG